MARLEFLMSGSYFFFGGGGLVRLGLLVKGDVGWIFLGSY